MRKLTNGDLHGMDAGQLREHLTDYLTDLDGDDAFDEYAVGVARIIANLLYGEASKAPWIIAEIVQDLEFDSEGNQL